ncbi:sensor histidine kinase [Roseburia sp. AM51-8]|nr:sensor histidine kinase [Roseburia sp. AM51-8]
MCFRRHWSVSEPCPFHAGKLGHLCGIDLKYHILGRSFHAFHQDQLSYDLFKAYTGVARCSQACGWRRFYGSYSATAWRWQTDEMEVLIEDFNTMVTELAANETLKSDFIANVSHEIKTPIAIIQNYAQMLESQHLTEQEKKEYIHTIVESSERLSGLVQNILRLNKMEGQAIVEKERFCLDEQLAECIIAFDEPFDEKELEVNIDLDEGVYIVSDESLLSIVWNNLLSNAIKYTQEGGTIDISMKKYGENGVLVSVKDNGCGMSEEVVCRIFDKFYQGDTSHTSKGNGLGLAMVKRVVELLDAKISVESEPGKGSTFTVEL